VDRVIKVCDLHSEDTPAAASLRLVGLGKDRRLDVCDQHLSVLKDLPVEDGPAGDAVEEMAKPATPVARAQSRPRPAQTRPRPTAARSAAAKRTTTTEVGATKAGKQSGSRRSLQRERAIVREWARQQGRAIGDKGRLPTGLVEEYRRTHQEASA
jgi:hypothetical protein